MQEKKKTETKKKWKIVTVALYLKGAHAAYA